MKQHSAVTVVAAVDVVVTLFAAAYFSHPN